MSELQFNDIFGNEEPFKCIYVLYGEKKECPDRYELTDLNGNKININDLNGYQKGVVLNDCWAYFTGGKYHSDTEDIQTILSTLYFSIYSAFTATIKSTNEYFR